MRTIQSIAFFLVPVLLISCTGTSDAVGSLTKEALAVTEGYVRAWAEKDIRKFEEIFHTGPELHIFEVRQIFDGWDAWESRLEASFTSVEDVDVHFRNTKVHVSPDGCAAWINTIEDATWLDNGEPREVKDMRVSWSLIRQDGCWNIIQAHWSIP